MQNIMPQLDAQIQKHIAESNHKLDLNNIIENKLQEADKKIKEKIDGIIKDMSENKNSLLKEIQDKNVEQDAALQDLTEQL